MRYKEYRLKDSCKRLGLLGETHNYSPEESSFAKSVIPNYDTVAIEGHEYSDTFTKLLGLLYLPTCAAFMLGAGRTSETAESIAITRGARIAYLHDSVFNIWQKFMLTAIGIALIPMSPYIYFECYSNRMRNEKPEELSQDSLLYKIMKYAFNGEERDNIMGLRAVDLLANEKSLLTVCGEHHFEGVNAYFNKFLALEKKTEVKI